MASRPQISYSYSSTSLLRWQVESTNLNAPHSLSFYPPRADILIEASQSDSFPRPLNAQIHVSSEDWQSGPEGVVAFGSAVGIPVTVVDGEGHMMSVDYVGGVLDTHLR